MPWDTLAFDCTQQSMFTVNEVSQSMQPRVQIDNTLVELVPSTSQIHVLFYDTRRILKWGGGMGLINLNSKRRDQVLS